MRLWLHLNGGGINSKVRTLLHGLLLLTDLRYCEMYALIHIGERCLTYPQLLLPDIRTTVSNLSQAIRFLVANDFLDGVELKPGDGDSQMIQVLGSSDIRKDVDR